MTNVLTLHKGDGLTAKLVATDGEIKLSVHSEAEISPSGFAVAIDHEAVERWLTSPADEL